MQTSQARRAHRVITTDDGDGISTTPASSTGSGEPVALSSKPHRHGGVGQCGPGSQLAIIQPTTRQVIVAAIVIPVQNCRSTYSECVR